MIRSPYPLAAFLASLLACAGQAFAEGLPHNWPMPPSELERRLAHDNFTIMEVKGAGGGVTGASRLLLRFDDGKTLKAKWKGVPKRTADNYNNCPRKEIASYQLQRWLFDENDYVVPTAAARCLTFDEYRAIDSRPKSNIDGARCVLGILAVWMEDVTAPKKFHDKKRFERDPMYAGYMADFNLLGYLLDHRDGRQGNLLLSTDPADPRVFAVDNGISFDPFPWNFFVTNWNKIHVPWLRRASVDRLRKVDEKTIDELGVVAELAADENGVYRVVEPGPNLDPEDGVRFARGRIQFGLEDEELEDVKKRIRELLEDVDKGKIEVR